MKIFWTIVTIIVILTIGMFGFRALVMDHGASILEFDHPSRNIGHSIQKEIFIDTLLIVEPDTIITKGFERVDILPTSSWIEKKTYWKSGTMDLDSLGFVSDSVVLIMNFRNFKDGRPWTPSHGYYIGDFEDSKGHHESVYIDEEITQLRFETRIDDAGDTIRLTTKDQEQIILHKRRS
jgi:hypothetical protein